MKALTLATQMLLIVTVVVGGISYAFDWVRERRIKKYEATAKMIGILVAQETLRRKER